MVHVFIEFSIQFNSIWVSIQTKIYLTNVFHNLVELIQLNYESSTMKQHILIYLFISM